MGKLQRLYKNMRNNLHKYNKNGINGSIFSGTEMARNKKTPGGLPDALIYSACQAVMRLS